MEYEKSSYKATTWYPTYKECIKNEDELINHHIKQQCGLLDKEEVSLLKDK